jgi:putative ATP-binding cassette transporter
MSMPIDGLSGGEHQRLALARLFLHRPAWIFLDEAMSALDTRAENHLLKRLRHDLPGSTFVIVSHRSPEAIGGVRIVDLDRSKPAGTHAGTMEDA